jgi:6-phosphogluconolactonase
MKKLLLMLSLGMPMLCFAQKNPKLFDLLVGTYTKGTSKGIYVYRFDAQTGKITYLNEIDGIANPTYLCITGNRKFVYSGGENKPGEVSAFKFDYVTGKLELLNEQPSGASTVHVAVDKGQKNVFAAAYSGGNAMVFPINKDGSLAPAVQTLQDTGKGFNKNRQEAPHVHSTKLSNDEKYLLTADLGTDKIGIYNYNPSKAPVLTPADPQFETVKPGDGPRHFEFSPNGKYVYLVHEMGGDISAYSFNKGKLTFLQNLSLTAADFKGRTSGADVHISPDGAYLYASNRGSANEITQYAINKNNGQLTFVERYPTDKTPRSFVIEPSGNFMLVAAQDGNTVTEFKIDKSTGKLTLMPEKIEVNQAVCVKLVSAE